MKNPTVSEWKTVLIWGLAWRCMLMEGWAIAQDQGNGLIKFECEMLPVENCAFAVGAGGFRCVVETALHVDGSITYECQTVRLALQLGDTGISIRKAYVETDDCINACGLKRLTIGVSTDDIYSDNGFREKLCSPDCTQRCANIIDHYETIMAEEGEDLSRVCQNLMDYIAIQREREKKPAVKIATGEREVPKKSKRSSPVIEQQESRQESGLRSQQEMSTRHPSSNTQQVLHEQQAPGPSTGRWS